MITRRQANAGVLASAALGVLWASTRVTLAAVKAKIRSPNNDGAPGPLRTTYNLVTDFGGDWAAWVNFQRTAGRYLTLEVPAGTYDMAWNQNARLPQYWPGATIQGAGAATTIINQIQGFWGLPMYGEDSYGNGCIDTGNPSAHCPVYPSSPRIESVEAGATSITVLEPWRYKLSTPPPQVLFGAENRFHVGKWIMISGVDMMGYGNPINNAFNEFRQITAVDPETGVIKFDEPLKFTYKSTWPVIWGGNWLAPDQGGSAMINPMQDNWDIDVIVRDVTINNSYWWYGEARNTLFENCIFTGFPPIPSVNKSWICRNCKFADVGIEADKAIDYVELNGCTSPNNIHFQSSSTNRLRVVGCQMEGLVGTGQGADVVNSSFSGLRLGPLSYGVTSDPITIDNCHVEDLISWTSRGCSLGTLSNGVITYQKATMGDALIDLIPGGWYYFTSWKEGSWLGTCPPVFTITDVWSTEDKELGTLFHYQTNLPPEAEIPTIVNGLVDGIRPHAAPWLTVTNSTGQLGYLSYPEAAGLPLGCYWKMSSPIFINNWPYLNAQFNIPLFGYLKKITVDVTKASTRQGGLSLGILTAPEYQGETIVHEDGTLSRYHPVVNLAIAGKRVITNGSVVGAQSGDSLTPWTGDKEWLPIAPQTGISGNISGEDPSTWSEFSIELILDQGIPQQSALPTTHQH